MVNPFSWQTQEDVVATWKHIATIMALVGSLSITGMALAQSPKNDEKTPGKSVDLNSFVCKDLMRTSGDDRDMGLALLQGYFLGKKGLTTYQAEKVREITDQLIEYCLDNPTSKLLEAMGKLVP